MINMIEMNTSDYCCFCILPKLQISLDKFYISKIPFKADINDYIVFAIDKYG